MPMLNAIGSSLVAATVFGLTTAINYAVPGLAESREQGCAWLTALALKLVQQNSAYSFDEHSEGLERPALYKRHHVTYHF